MASIPGLFAYPTILLSSSSNVSQRTRYLMPCPWDSTLPLDLQITPVPNSCKSIAPRKHWSFSFSLSFFETTDSLLLHSSITLIFIVNVLLKSFHIFLLSLSSPPPLPFFYIHLLLAINVTRRVHTYVQTWKRVRVCTFRMFPVRWCFVPSLRATGTRNEKSSRKREGLTSLSFLYFFFSLIIGSGMTEHTGIRRVPGIARYPKY